MFLKSYGFTTESISSSFSMGKTALLEDPATANAAGQGENKKNIFVTFLLVSLSLAGTACSKQTLSPSRQEKVMQEYQNDRPIGTAKMLADGTVVLTLRAETGSAVGHAEFEYAKNDPESVRILMHIAGIKPGEEHSPPALARVSDKLDNPT